MIAFNDHKYLIILKYNHIPIRKKHNTTEEMHEEVNIFCKHNNIFAQRIFE